MITPLELENKRFPRKHINGYDPEEVDDFLDELLKDYETLYKNKNGSGSKVEELEERLAHYEQIESTLQSTLVMAQQAADDAREAAQKQAEQIIKEAENKAKEATLDITTQIADKQREFEELKKQFDVYKAKMEALIVAQGELLKDINED